MSRSAKRILWADDEIDLLKPHVLFLQQRGYHVDAISNGDDALVLLRTHPYDLVLLDEQMPGRRGVEVLETLRREDPNARVVMVTKSEDDRTMTEAIGRRVDDYLVKPTSPRQVLSVVLRILEGSSIRQQRVAQDFAARFQRLSLMRRDARNSGDFGTLYAELVDWHIRLENAGEPGLLSSVESLATEVRQDFSGWMAAEYPRWMKNLDGERPDLSIDLVKRHIVPLLGDEPVFFVILDCMRLDQWRMLLPLLAEYFEVEEELYFSILPTATPYSRNAIFSGRFPDEIAEERPKWWESFADEGSLNNFEDELLSEQLERLTGGKIPVHYEKLFTDRDGDQVRGRVNSALKTGAGVIAIVSNFVDLMTHGRSESAVLMEVARDDASLRNLTRSWFERSTVFKILKEAASSGLKVLLTTDHGSIHCHRPTTVFARRDATTNLRFKFGADLHAKDRSTVFSTREASDLRLPKGKLGMSYVLALEDYFMVYPTKLREYQARYRGAFLHGGISPEEVILPVARLTPRPQ